MLVGSKINLEHKLADIRPWLIKTINKELITNSRTKSNRTQANQLE